MKGEDFSEFSLPSCRFGATAESTATYVDEETLHSVFFSTTTSSSSAAVMVNVDVTPRRSLKH